MRFDLVRFAAKMTPKSLGHAALDHEASDHAIFDNVKCDHMAFDCATLNHEICDHSAANRVTFCHETSVRARLQSCHKGFPSSWALATAVFLILLTGCTVGPNYHRPNVATAPAWKEQPPWRTADPKDSIPKGNWWTTFADPELDQYETQALKSNQTIDAARYQLQQARASARITQSGLFPQLTAGISAQRAQTSVGKPTASGIPLASPTLSNDFIIPFNFTWEPDVFGGVCGDCGVSVSRGDIVLASEASPVELLYLVMKISLLC